MHICHQRDEIYGQFVSSISLSFLKTDSGSQYKRMRNKFMALLTAERLYINQAGATVECAYEQVIAFTTICYTDDFGQVRKELVNVSQVTQNSW